MLSGLPIHNSAENIEMVDNNEDENATTTTGYVFGTGGASTLLWTGFRFIAPRAVAALGFTGSGAWVASGLIYLACIGVGGYLGKESGDGLSKWWYRPNEEKESQVPRQDPGGQANGLARG